MNVVELVAQAVTAELKRRSLVSRAECEQPVDARAGDRRAGRLDVPVGVSGRHVHLSAADIETLFGAGYTLQVRNPLSQPGQFAAMETVVAAGPGGAIERVRVLGPARKQSQVEITASDCLRLGIEPVVRESGDLQGTPGVALIGRVGTATLANGAIVAGRHVHMPASQAAALGLRDGQPVSVAVGGGPRRLLFFDVVLRARDDFALEYHIDTDEANAAGLISGDVVRLVCAGVRDDWMK